MIVRKQLSSYGMILGASTNSCGDGSRCSSGSGSRSGNVEAHDLIAIKVVRVILEDQLGMFSMIKDELLALVDDV